MLQTAELTQSYPNITESDKLYARALGLIPGVTQTLAKGPTQYINGVAPKYLRSGRGSHVWDVDGNEYIDFTMGVGPISLGYCYPRVDEAIRSQLKDGITFSMMHPLEVETAELIRSVIPSAEAIRFSKTGADVTSAAVRLARAYTKRNKVLCCGYHGWHDWYIGVTDRDSGIPQTTKDLSFTFNYNDIASVESSVDDDTACIILEPVVFEEPRDNFLGRLREICDRRGIVLIFDEMWTGFRLAPGGAQEYFGVTADLACYSKAIANGMPLSVLAGKKEIMELLEKDVFFFTTFGGEALSLAAACATIAEMKEHDVSGHLARQGEKIKDAYNATASQLGMHFTKCIGLPCRTITTFDAKAGDPLIMKSFVQQELFRLGILWSGFHNICFSHADSDIQHLAWAYGKALPLLSTAVAVGNLRELLRGEPVQPVFRRTSNFNTKPKEKVSQ
ncbi:MAG: aminotransferase class III-fold pyridoxal phosphate-dependent enzyme [Nitrospirae bacterium]|nr:aminotransferase class III-fold pyridoxal phosphate-dependent enzyme [Nitrospirota bacterium]